MSINDREDFNPEDRYGQNNKPPDSSGFGDSDIIEPPVLRHPPARPPQGSAPRERRKLEQPRRRPPEPQNTEKPERKQRKKRPKQRKKYRVLRALLITVAIVGFCAFLAFFALQSASDFLGISIDVAGLIQEDKTVTVKIPEGSSPSEIVKILGKSNVVDTPLAFTLYAKLKKVDDKFLPGEYVLNYNMSYEQIIIALKSGSAERQDVVKISFPEGLSLWEVGKLLEKNEVCTAQEFADVLQSGKFAYDFMADIPIDKPLRFYKYEGYVFPNTYDFFVPEKPESVAKKFFDSFNQNVTSDLFDRMKEVGMTLDETITLASIIQKEASFPEDMKAVSGVFHNRFADPETYPSMQSDVTIFYVEKFIKPRLTTQNQEMYDAYNTYKCIGLPVGPICNPGMDAIMAALYPDENDYYYFLTDKEGKFYYAVTMAEHEQNIAAAAKVGGVGGIATD